MKFWSKSEYVTWTTQSNFQLAQASWQLCFNFWVLRVYYAIWHWYNVPMGPNWPVQLVCILSYQALFMAQFLACGMLHCPRPRGPDPSLVLIKWDMWTKCNLGRTAICSLPACTTFVVYTIALFIVCTVHLKFPTLLLFNVDMHAVIMTTTSSWLWSVGAWFENLE
jgi:hypothetical protein